MSIFTAETSPRRRIEAVLMGHVDLLSAPPAVRSACRFYIYEGAVQILSLPTKEARLRALNRLPAKIRPHIEAEALRIWEMRRNE